MKIVLGLGNPGARYERTRHNIGWLVLDAVAARLRGEFKAGKGEYYEASVRWRGKDALLVKPTTYMNESGVAAMQLVRRYGVTPADILVVVDELQFPTGRVQLKPSGSSGGHNGLESLIYHFSTDQFPRLRCGIGNDFERGRMADYVLSDFPSDQQPLVEEMIEKGREATLLWIGEGTSRAMNLMNTKEREAKKREQEAGSGNTTEGQRDVET